MNLAAAFIAASNGRVLYRISAVLGQLHPERSDDRASTWQPIPLPGNRYPTVLAVDPRDEYSVWATAAGVLYHSLDGGGTWQKAELPHPSSWQINSMTFDPSGRVLHVAFESHGVWELELR